VAPNAAPAANPQAAAPAEAENERTTDAPAANAKVAKSRSSHPAKPAARAVLPEEALAAAPGTSPPPAPIVAALPKNDDNFGGIRAAARPARKMADDDPYGAPAKPMTSDDPYAMK
jgi:hypothetical protein